MRVKQTIKGNKRVEVKDEVISEWPLEYNSCLELFMTKEYISDSISLSWKAVTTARIWKADISGVQIMRDSRAKSFNKMVSHFFHLVTLTWSPFSSLILGSSVQGGWSAFRQPCDQNGNHDPENSRIIRYSFVRWRFSNFWSSCSFWNENVNTL